MARHWSEGGSATVGRLLLAAIARGARTAAVMGELADRRTALSREYQFADGSRKVEVYLEPINYEDASGIWQHMGEKLSVSKRAGFALENQTNIFATYLGGGDSRGTVKIEEGSLGLTISPLEALTPADPSLATPAVLDGTVTYADLFPGTSARYSILPAGERGSCPSD